MSKSFIQSVVILSTLVMSPLAFAAPAEIRATLDNGTVVTIALDAHNRPRVKNDPRAYPTIKDFGDSTDYVSFCYDGSFRDTGHLLKGLVYAADGDGDSWADLKSIDLADDYSTIIVVAEITNEGGPSEEEYRFPLCPQSRR